MQIHFPNIITLLQHEAPTDVSKTNLLEQKVASLATLLYNNDASFSSELQQATLFSSNILDLHFNIQKAIAHIEKQNATHPIIDSSISEETPEENSISEIPTEDIVPPAPVAESIMTEESSNSSTQAIEATPEIVSNENTFLLAEEIEDDPQEEDAEMDTDEDSFLANKLGSVLSHQLAEFQKKVDPNAALLPNVTNPPAFTKDYFKAQGIQLSEHADGVKKVKKFTDWIKQMKKISPNPTDLGSTEAEEKEIMEKAEKSNQKAEVLTESMLDVLIQQGKKEEAAMLIQKLSLLNPEKSIYFAQKLVNFNN